MRARARQRYIRKGYAFETTPAGALVTINVRDLPRSSRERVGYVCDGCGKSGTSVYFALVEKQAHACQSCARKGKPPSNKITFDPKTSRTIAERFRAGESAPELATIFGTSPTVVRRLVSEAGVSLRREKKLSPADELEVVRLYDGESMARIAKRFGVSKQPILTILRRHKVSIRSTSQAMRGRRAHNRQQFTTAQIQEIGRLWQVTRLTLEQIAKRFGCRSTRPIHRVINEHGFAKETTAARQRREEQRQSAATVERLAAGEIVAATELFDAGLSFEEIAEQLVMDRRVLSAALKERGKENDGALIPSNLRQTLLREFSKNDGHRSRQLAKRLGLKPQVVLNFLHSRGVDTAKAYGIDVDQLVEWHEQGLTTIEMATHLSQQMDVRIQQYTIAKMLKAKGIALGTYTHRYPHRSPSDPSTEMRLRGAWEKDVARYLDLLLHSKDVRGWRYEGDRIQYSDGKSLRTYVPDFTVEHTLGHRELWEVKGRQFKGTDAKHSAARKAGYAVRVINEASIRDIWSKVVRREWDWPSRTGGGRARYAHLDNSMLLGALSELGGHLERNPDRRILDWLKGFPSASVFARRFGSFGKALQLAGFEQVRRKYKARDGHWCDSGAERLVDNFLHRHGIKHSVHEPYPVHPKLNPNRTLIADWMLTDGRFVEYFGVLHNARYEARAARKADLAKALGLELVVLGPEDLRDSGLALHRKLASTDP